MSCNGLSFKSDSLGRLRLHSRDRPLKSTALIECLMLSSFSSTWLNLSFIVFIKLFSTVERLSPFLYSFAKDWWDRDTILKFGRFKSEELCGAAIVSEVTKWMR